jgi:CO dehydrogenase maturation factor
MRVALAGKGGAGKTTISATLARLLAARGEVVAVDADSNPNLATALGLSPDSATSHAVVPHALVSRRADGAALKDPVEAVLQRHALVTADGIRVLLMGAPDHADQGCLCSAHATVSALLADLGGQPDVAVIIDMEASPEHLSRGTARHVDTLLLVTEPYYRSLETVRRLAQLARELPIPAIGVVANKVRNDDELEAITEFCGRHGLELLAVVPRSDAVVDADIAGVTLFDQLLAAGSDGAGHDVMAAVTGLADRLQAAAMADAGGQPR